MSASDSLETSILNHIFINSDIANIGDATGLRGSSTAGSLYISFHTADPTDAGNQTSSECDYTSYARVAVARAGAQWTTTNDTVTNDNAISFPACTGGSNTATYFGIGTDTSGTGTLLFSGALDSSLAISTGITPEFAAGDLDVTAA